MKLYTKTGDDGTTGMFGGGRVPKTHPRVVAYGEVDELNAFLGAAAAVCRDATTKSRLLDIQADLFLVGSELATPSGKTPPQQLMPDSTSRLEVWIDEASASVPALRTFILPGGSESAARLHVARGVCRRAERAVIALPAAELARTEVIIYLNRLSDLLFALARLENQTAQVPDVPWDPSQR